MLCLAGNITFAQSIDVVADSAVKFPTRLLARLQSRTVNLDKQLTQQTEKYLQKMQRREQRLRKKLYAADSTAAKQLFAGSDQQYAAMTQKILTEKGSLNVPLNGTYLPYVDSVKGALGFLQKNPVFLGAPAGKLGAGQLGISNGPLAQLSSANSKFQALQAKMQDADQIKAYIQQRKQIIGNYISQHASLQGMLGKDYAGLNQDVYYYSQQLKEYKDMWSQPDKLEQKALQLLNKLPAFQNFMKQNSQLAGLFNLPGNYGNPASLSGLQTRDQVSALVKQQVATGGADGAAALQSNLQSAQSQLDNYKSKLSSLGNGGGEDIDMPDFKPNEQKTKTFWHRLEYGTNFQTTHNNAYFPTTTDLGFSLGYKLGHSNTVGIGASYKLGWGNGIQHIAFSSQGAGLRSFLDIHLKGSFSATGGLELNYATPFSNYQQLKQIQDWTRSGLIGISKTVSMRSRVFKKTKLQLLWDFLSYQQVPKTQAILFRIGYSF